MTYYQPSIASLANEEEAFSNQVLLFSKEVAFLSPGHNSGDATMTLLESRVDDVDFGDHLESDSSILSFQLGLGKLALLWRAWSKLRAGVFQK
jgi:hypothetical protein